MINSIRGSIHTNNVSMHFWFILATVAKNLFLEVLYVVSVANISSEHLVWLSSFCLFFRVITRKELGVTCTSSPGWLIVLVAWLWQRYQECRHIALPAFYLLRWVATFSLIKLEDRVLVWMWMPFHRCLASLQRCNPKPSLLLSGKFLLFVDPLGPILCWNSVLIV